MKNHPMHPTVDLDHAKQTSFSHSKKTAAKPATFTKTKGRRCLNLSQRVELIAFHKKKPSFGVRKLAERFDCGRSQVSEILKSKDTILKEWEINGKLQWKKEGKSAEISQN